MLASMLQSTQELGASVFQICDYSPLGTLSDAQLREVRAQATDLGIKLELGTRGVSLEHLRRYLEIADLLDASFVRTMLDAPTKDGTLQRQTDELGRALTDYKAQGVTLGLETYEQVPVEEMVQVVEAINEPYLGICLDPANCVARLEMPADVVRRTAPYVVNLHIKDFHFVRQPGLVGFLLVGCPLGTGLLDYDGLIRDVRPWVGELSQIVEHWVTPVASKQEACRTEADWTRHSVRFLETHMAGVDKARLPFGSWRDAT